MSNLHVQAIVLAAGKSTRFNTGNSKLLEKLCGQEMILYPAQLLTRLNIPTTFVIGYQAEEIKKLLTFSIKKELTFVWQNTQKGTGDALAHTQRVWNADHILVLNGDVPLITQDLIEQLLQKHINSNAVVSFITSHHMQPEQSSYGRVIKEENSIKIIEEKDLKNNNTESCCINAGIYLFKRKFLEENLLALTNKNAAQEFYITDLINIANEKKLIIETINAPFDQIRGINTLKELWTAEQIKRSEMISYWMERGVRFDVAQSIHIDFNVSIGSGTKIGAGVHVLDGTVIGKNCLIEPFCILANSTIQDHAVIFSHSIITNSTIEERCLIGPFAHVHKQSTVKNSATIGNFVEVSRSTIGMESKAKHLSYLGNAVIGTNTNIGAGTIVCNYDGKDKHATVIQDEVFIGSNNTLVAPLTIEKGSYTAAGSTITQNVPADSLAIARAHQTNKEGYAQKLRNKKKNSSKKKENKTAFFGATKTNHSSSI